MAGCLRGIGGAGQGHGSQDHVEVPSMLPVQGSEDCSWVSRNIYGHQQQGRLGFACGHVGCGYRLVSTVGMHLCGRCTG